MDIADIDLSVRDTFAILSTNKREWLQVHPIDRFKQF